MWRRQALRRQALRRQPERGLRLGATAEGACIRWLGGRATQPGCAGRLRGTSPPRPPPLGGPFVWLPTARKLGEREKAGHLLRRRGAPAAHGVRIGPLLLAALASTVLLRCMVNAIWPCKVAPYANQRQRRAAMYTFERHAKCVGTNQTKYASVSKYRSK